MAHAVRHPFPVSAHVCCRFEKKLRHLASLRLTCMLMVDATYLYGGALVQMLNPGTAKARRTY